MKVYQTDSDGYFVGEITAQESPLEPGVYLIPAGAYETPPPQAGEGEVAQMAGGYWRLQTIAAEPEEPQDPEPSEEEALIYKRQGQSLTFPQLLIGLVQMEWITESEGEAWLSGNALPDEVLSLIAGLPADERFPAKARALRMTQAERLDPLTIGLATVRGVSPEELDEFFDAYGTPPDDPVPAGEGISRAAFIAGLGRAGIAAGDTSLIPSRVTRSSPSVVAYGLPMGTLNMIFEGA